MELFRDDGCLTDEGLRALTAGQLEELGRLEAAEHLSYCDVCMDRYTSLLTEDALEMPPRSMRGTVMSTIWVRLMQNTMGRVAVAGVAAVLALSLWKTGTLTRITRLGDAVNAVLPASQSQPAETEPVPLGKPVETQADRNSEGKPSRPLQQLLDGITHSTTKNPIT